MKISSLMYLGALAIGSNPVSAETTSTDLDLATIIEQSDGRATLVVLDHSNTGDVFGLAERLSSVADRVRVGVGAYGPDTDEGRTDRLRVIEHFQSEGFQVCAEWGSLVYDPSVAEDVYNRWLARLGDAFTVASDAALVIDNGEISMAGAELGQDYLVPGAGTAEDRLLVDLLGSSGGVEVRDDLSFAQLDLLVDSESVGTSSWDCMKGNSR